MTDIKGQVVSSLALIVLMSVSGAQNHFVWPKELFVISTEEWHSIPSPQLPKNADFLGLLSNSEILKSRTAVYINLNHDGAKALIIKNWAMASNLSDCSIYQRLRGQWSLIGHYQYDNQDGCKFCRRSNGYYQLEAWITYNFGVKSRSLYRFQDGRYHLIRLENYQDGHFVNTLDPKPFDN